MDNIIQGSPEWLQLRCGKATASRIADIIARTKSGYSASRKNYEAQLIAERLTGNIESGFTSGAMQWGTDTEPRAREAYQFITDTQVELVGFVDHPRIAMSGASPDGLVNNDGLVEIKCPNTATHLETLESEKVPAKYNTQIQWQLACTDRAWCDFVSFDPRLPETMRMFKKRVERDQTFIDEVELAVTEFLNIIDEKVAKLIELYGEAA